ncbi:MAG: bifunctional phosphoribosylaminoimidazolecarboxamide formyltransferase/IMP cyclohydrolase [Flavobacteriales bacterium]|nr:bifunctional phosphoribosylaminoimidazolecarboxamide formyltransferase/IMP cyclohydrolase [Flavobacteriales bacterium]NNK81388.1 bifunctional phosphoribosylaminoimidazolecarboxamide formyltransferase/IMP cyclohydrolase [Flavobacteriales bacterium]
MSNIKIKNALISVYHKDGLIPVVDKLNSLGVALYSTGGTQRFIEEQGVTVNRVEDLTGYPSILGGRVKTLHPKVFGGILARRHEDTDVAQVEEYAIPEMDLVIVDLYPFENTVAGDAGHDDIIEKIDIGGISLIRAAAKNYRDVLIVSNRNQYSKLLDVLVSGNGVLDEPTRKVFAMEAFAVSSHYDLAIHAYFSGQSRALELDGFNALRYGENPHQKGVFYGDLEELFEKLHGKELSYNNLLDVDAAVALMSEFKNDNPTFAILKHNNACGLATRNNLSDAYSDALAGDPISAFGGILICNQKMDLETAKKVNTLFCEVVIAPSFEPAALELLKSKKNRILLLQKTYPETNDIYRTALNGVLWQEKDNLTDNKEGLDLVTNEKPTEAQLQDLIFASKIAKHTKSNTIVLAKDGQLLASGTGQTSRVDALNQAVDKAERMGLSLDGAAMASDAFFPFPDCVEIADKAGIRAVIQPGGSIKDQLSIDYCNENGLAMVMTGTRHFKH